MKENLLKIREELGEHLVPGEDEYYSSLRPFETNQGQRSNHVTNEPNQQSQLGYPAQPPNPETNPQHMIM